MNESVEKDICDMLAVKHDIIELLIRKETEDKITHEEVENFIFFINVMLKRNKSKNSIEGRITGLQNVIKDCYYNKFKQINDNYVKNN